MELMISEDMVAKIVNDTNNYYQSNERFKNRRVRDHEYAPVTAAEIWIFFALKITIGSFHNVPDVKQLWSKHHLLHIPCISMMMACDRYLFISSALHFSDDTDSNPKDPMWKLRELMNIINKNFQTSFNLGQGLSIDESLLK
jgi:hypothetical protein